VMVADPPYVILVVGAGEIGSRYLQGLAKCSHRLRIHVVDVSPDAIIKSRRLWLEVVNCDNVDSHISFHNNIQECPKEVDVAIVATTARKRGELVALMKRHLVVRYWILEKLLVQSAAELDNLSKILSGAKIWVNTPRRMLPWHKQIRTSLIKQAPLHLKVTGKAWGLACNSVHFLDMFSWFTGEPLESISTEELSRHWIKAKRPGNWEILGEFKSKFTGGSTATFSVEYGEPSDLSYQFHIEDGDMSWSIDEEFGTAVRSDGFSVSGRLPFLSEVTPLLVDEILSTGQCELPSLETSSETHRVFLAAMLEHWQNTMDATAIVVPIT